LKSLVRPWAKSEWASEVRDPRRQELIAKVLDDLARTAPHLPDDIGQTPDRYQAEHIVGHVPDSDTRSRLKCAPTVTPF
jgi:hypothetical protein